MRVAETNLDTIGNTPLVKLNHVTESIAATVLAKIEYVNPGGAVKDRIAIKIIDAAEAEGKLRPGGTIVEPTSGNTGVGLQVLRTAAASGPLVARALTVEASLYAARRAWSM